MKLKLWKMVWVLITLASILAITKGFPSCMVETNSIVCSFEKETEEKEIKIIHFHPNDTVGSLLVKCGLHHLNTCCTDNECSNINIKDTVNIMINIKDYSGKIGCFLVPSTTNSFNICNLTAFNTSPVSIINSTSADKPAINTSRVSIINSTSADKPGTCEQRILDYIHHIQQHFWAVAVAVPVAVAVILVILIKRTSNSTQSTSCCTGVHKNNNSEQTSTSLLNVELGEVPQNGTQVHTEECLKQPFLSHTPQNNGHTL